MRYCLSFFCLVFCAHTFADVVTRVIDTGPGLATVTRFDNGQIMVYDTGHWDHDPDVFTAFQNFIGDHDIDLLITSHSDSDHVAATDELLGAYRVHRVIRTGFERIGTRTWEDHRDAVVAASLIGLTHDVNLAVTTLPHGTPYRFGASTVFYLSGFHEPPDDWGIPRSSSEFRNANSIVVRLEYEGNSILFTGDAVGRVEGTADDTAAMGTEMYLINNRVTRPIASDILIAPHHGGDDGSLEDFINAVNARWVIFSSGHANDHPLDVTAGRYTGLGYAAACLLRTDLGDDEGNDEWNHGRINNNSDPVLDDSIEIRLPEDGTDATVGYVGRPAVVCPDLGLSLQNSTPPPVEVRLNRSQICHTPDSPFYERRVHFDLFSSLQACLAAGGRERN